ncbi:MAG: DNA adenine methylase [Candidatus Poribacteria bacterium]|nr:DNA adenine methylase [Candidatus Poribacteria bacterium]MDE0506618.1 DNA adenine methylase [Candidatus Poribacteria bacterium]
MRYIGRKTNLLPYIEDVVLKNASRTGVFCDLFAGTHSVAAHFKRLGFQIISNDLLCLAYVFGRALIQNNEEPAFSALPNLPNTPSGGLFNGMDAYLRVLNYLNGLVGVSDGFIFNTYCPGGANEYCRQYLSDRNGKKIDAIRQRIEEWKRDNLVTEDEYYSLLLSLLEAVSKVTNISGTYGAYLKEWDARTYKELTLDPITPIPSNKEHSVYQQDANRLIEQIECDILYIDPPYNPRQYITNYHLLETIARYDNPSVYGKTGLRPYSDSEKSAYCSRGACLRAFAGLISRAKAKHIIVSYNSEGIMSDAEIHGVLSEKGEVPKLIPIDYRRFKSNSTGKLSSNKNVREYLFYVQTN